MYCNCQYTFTWLKRMVLCEVMHNSVCPYCKKDVGREIKRKIICRFCNKNIFIRQGKVVSEREKEIIDWQRYMDFLVPDINQIRRAVEQSLSKRFGSDPSSHDLIWGMFNYIVARKRNAGDLETLYSNMAIFLDSEGKHTQAADFKKQAFKMKIIDLRRSDIYIGVTIKNREDDFVCEECVKLQNKTFTLAEAFQTPPLPVTDCLNKQCRCWSDFRTKYDDVSKVSETTNTQTISIEIEKPQKKKSLLKQLFGL